jgi:uncharacterized protein (DUF1330 family)
LYPGRINGGNSRPGIHPVITRLAFIPLTGRNKFYFAQYHKSINTKTFIILFITQLVYIKVGQERAFQQFEDIAIPAILKYNGRLLLRVRPTDDSIIEHHIDKPYEIHLVEFASEQDFENFMKDEDRKKFLHLKEQSIQSVLLFKGTKL